MSPAELMGLAKLLGASSRDAGMVLAALCACSDPVQVHRHALPSVLGDFGSGFDLQTSRFAIAVCHELIRRGVPCEVDGKPFAAGPLIASKWPASVEAELSELMRAYVRHGYIALTAEKSKWPSNYSLAFVDGETALEAAIRLKHMPAATVLLEEGADLRTVPTRKWPSDPPYADMLELCRAYWSGDAEQLVSKLTEAAMRGRIAAAATGSASDESVARRRRVAL